LGRFGKMGFVEGGGGLHAFFTVVEKAERKRFGEAKPKGRASCSKHGKRVRGRGAGTLEPMRVPWKKSV